MSKNISIRLSDDLLQFLAKLDMDRSAAIRECIRLTRDNKLLDYNNLAARETIELIEHLSDLSNDGSVEHLRLNVQLKIKDIRAKKLNFKSKRERDLLKAFIARLADYNLTAEIEKIQQELIKLQSGLA